MTKDIYDVVKAIDWDLFREQKAYCFNEANNNQDAAHIYEGILCLMDAIQDAADDMGLVTTSDEDDES